MAKVLKAFLMGGVMGIITQALLILWTAVLGPESAFVGPVTLVSLGVLTLITFPCGLYKKLEDFGGWGLMLTFSGLAAAVAGNYLHVKAETGSARAAVAAGFKLVFSIVGCGAVAFIIVDLVFAMAL